MSRKELHTAIITKDSFADDFNFRRIKNSLSMTYRQGKIDKENEIKSGGKKEKDKTIEKDAKKLLWRFVGEQWCLLLVGLPFMFAGSLIEFLAPNIIGRIMDQFRVENFEGDGGVYELIVTWMFWLVISSLCSFTRELLFGITSQRLGFSLRNDLFKAIIDKDVTFFDNFRTGDMLSRLGSDTQVVQDGLTTSVAMFIKALAVVVGTCVILFTYEWRLAIIIIVVILPQIIASRISAAYLNAFAVKYQKAKAEMSNIGAESISNIRTLKAFSDEEMTSLRF